MSPPSAELGGEVRIAVLGAATREGSLLREALADRGVAGDRVELFGVAEGEVVLSEYAGEARIVQAAEPEAIARHELVFLCERDEGSVRRLEAPSCRTWVVDLVGSGSRGRLVHPELRPAPAEPKDRFFAVPHALSAILAELLAPLDRRFGLVEAVAFVLRPVSDFGPPGLEELREQTVRLLRLEPPPTEVFGRQIAFNLIPQGQLDPGEASLEERVCSEVGDLLAWPEPKLAARLIVAPVFYGHGIGLRVALERSASASEIVAGYEGSQVLRPPTSPAAGTPIETSETGETTVAEIVEDGLGGFWLWALVSEGAAVAAELAVDVGLGLVQPRRAQKGKP